MLILFGHALLVLFFTIRILSRSDLSPVARLAWFIVLLSLPYIGTAIYLLFGEINIGHATHQRSQNIAQEVRDLARTEAQDHWQSIPCEYRTAFHYAASINGFTPYTNNHIELMPGAQQARQRLLDDIDQAQHSVAVLYYIWLEDETGSHVAEALIRAAQRGVNCMAMADGLGSRAIIKSILWKRMQAAGVKISIALPFSNILRTLIFSRLDLRNHRKITVIDNRISYCGSQNCADPEFRVKPKYAPWVDIMLRLEGDVVRQNQLLFASDWLLHNPNAKLCQFPRSASSNPGSSTAQILGDGPTLRHAATPQLFSTLIHTAQRELIISTPYFVPDATVLEALCSAAYRGVTVKIIFPQNNDSWVVSAASRSYYYQMLKAGITIYEFQPGLLHSKTLTIDACVALVGSSNMDLRSFDLNYENDLLIYDQQVTAAIIERQKNYIADSIQVLKQEVKRWPLHKRLWNNVIATIGPVL